MSFTDRLVLALHIAFVIFTIGPVTAAIMSSPRAIRTRNVVVLQHLLVMTRIFGTASLGVLVFGIILGQQQKDLSQAWLKLLRLAAIRANIRSTSTRIVCGLMGFPSAASSKRCAAATAKPEGGCSSLAVRNTWFEGGVTRNHLRTSGTSR